VLAQVGVIDQAKMPVKSVESAHKLLDWSGIKSAR
jgi:hypothetical protein